MHIPILIVQERSQLSKNGIIENYQELKIKLQKEGIVFNSDTDTEVIPHLIQKELLALSQLKLESNGSTLLVAVKKRNLRFRRIICISSIMVWCS